MLKLIALIFCLHSMSAFCIPFDFFLIRGLTRESGHWGSSFEKELKSKFPGSTVTYMDLPGSGIFYKDKASSDMNELMEQTRSYYLEKIESSKNQKIIIATSLAGMMMMEWVAKYEDDFDGLVLSSSGVKKVCKGNERIQLSSYPKTIGIGLSLSLEKKERRILSINSNDEANFDENLKDWIEVQQKRPMTTANILKQTLAGLTYQPSLIKPKLPILSLGSYGDKLTSAECIKDVARYFDTDLALHQSSGHGIPIDAPVWMVDEIESWILKRIDFN